MPTRLALIAVALGLLLSAGCGPPKLNESKSYTMTPGDGQVLDLPAVSKAQSVTVEFTSSKAEVTVYLLKDFKEDDGLNVIPSKAQIMKEEKGKSGSFTVEVPENTATRVAVRGAAEKTDVTLKVTNSK